MLTDFYNRISLPLPTAVIIAVSLMLVLGFAATRLPNVTTYILAGVLIGTNCLKLIPASVIEASRSLGYISHVEKLH